MKIVIGSKLVGEKNDPQVMAERLGARLVFWEDLVFEVRAGEARVFAGEEELGLAEVELAILLGWYKGGKSGIYRDMAYALALIFEASGGRYWNSEAGRQRSTTKLSQMVALGLAGVAVPATWFGLNSEFVMGRLAGVVEPYIVKAAAASRGKNNHLVQSREEVAEILGDGSGHFLVQEFIANDHDMRVICFGGVPRLAFRRFRADDSTHLNNISQGGRAEWLETLPEDLVTLGTRICGILGREMGGVDFIETIDNSGQKYYCLEVNAIPQLTSGADVEKKMAALIQTLNG